MVHSYVIGNIAIGFLADKFGRKPVLLAGVVWIACATCLCTWVSSFEALCGVRVLVGIGVSGCGVTCNTLMAELAPSTARAPFMAVLHVFWQIGVWMIVLMHSSLDWKGLVLLTAMPALFVLPMIVILLPESPRWCSLQPGKHAQMVENLDWLEFGPRFLQSATQRTAPSYGQRVVAIQEDSQGCSSFWESLCAAFHPTLRWGVTVPLWLIFFGLNYASYNNFMWIKEYYDHKDMDSEIDPLYASMALARVVGVLVATVLVSMIYNKRLLLSFAFLMAGISTAAAMHDDKNATTAFTAGALFEELVRCPLRPMLLMIVAGLGYNLCIFR